MRAKRTIQNIIWTLLALIITFIIAFPIYWMLNTSLKDSPELITAVPRFWPSKVQINHYFEAFKKVPLARYMLNTFFVATVSVIFQMVFGVLAAYSFSKGSFKGKNILFYIVMGALMIPGQVTFIPLYLLCTKLNWVNTFAGLILPNVVSVYNIFMLRQSFMSIDQSYIDAGKIDGLGTLGTIRYVMMPMCKPVIITFSLLSFVGGWNDYFWPKIIVNKDQYRMLSVGLIKLYDAYGENEVLESMNVVMSGAIISIIPCVILFIIFQKYMLTGYSKAAMK